jgi:hypothetical protein
MEARERRDRFSWTMGKGRVALKEGDVALLEASQRDGVSTYDSVGQQWMIRDTGFWRPKTLVEVNGEPVATLDRSFFGSKARVEVRSGRKYFCRVREQPLVRVSFHNAGGVEVLSYGLDPHDRTRVLLEVRNTWTPRGDLLLLIMLGHHVLHGLRREHIPASGPMVERSAG